MESEPTTPTTSARRPSGSSARRGSASAASRARTGKARVDPPRPAEAVAAEIEADAVALSAESSVSEAPTDAAETAAPVETPKAAAKPKRAPRKKAAPAAEPAEAEPATDDSEKGESDAEAPASDAAAVEAEAAAAPAEAPEVETDTAPATDTDAETDAEPASEPVPAKPARLKRKPVRAVAPELPAAPTVGVDVALSVQGLTKYFGDRPAVDGIDLEVAPGSFYGIVGPNGAGKTTTLSMITGLLRPDAGVVRVFGLDVWHNATLAKRKIGVLPDRLRLFDRLTGAEFLHHAGALRGLDRATIAQRSADLSAAFGLEHSLHRLVSDYSAGMTKKIAIAAAMIHAPRLLVLDEPFESVDPVSTAVVLEVLTKFTEAGGTVILSSHSMELTERVCDALAIIAGGQVLASGPIADVLEGRSLEERFVELAGGEAAVEGMEWLQNFSD